MHTGAGRVTEIYLDGSARITCPVDLVPAPGQYLLVHASNSDLPLPVPVFFYDSTADGFLAAPPLHPSLVLGAPLVIRGPLGHGFSQPASARKVALIVLDGPPARLHGLVSSNLTQGVEIVLVHDSPVESLPEAVEVQPLKALNEVCSWADFIAMDVTRDHLPDLRKRLAALENVAAVREAQILVHTHMPCGGVAECGVCAVSFHHDWKMACKDGPVFALKDLLK